jgi:hypothetical protein
MMEISATVIPGHRQRIRPLAVNRNPDEGRSLLLNSGFKRFALAPE